MLSTFFGFLLVWAIMVFAGWAIIMFVIVKLVKLVCGKGVDHE